MHTKSRNPAGEVLHLKRAASAEKEEFKAVLRTWLESVRASTGWSFERIAREAETSATTLTRFMKPEYPHLLSLETVRKISAATRIAPPRGVRADFTPPGFQEAELRHWVPPTSEPSERNSVDWWEVRTELLDLEGILPGDKVAIDLNRLPQPGDVVIAQVEVDGGRDVETVLRKYEPPMLTCRTTLRKYPRPEFVDGQRIVIMGVAIKLRREMTSSTVATPAAAE